MGEAKAVESEALKDGELGTIESSGRKVTPLPGVFALADRDDVGNGDVNDDDDDI